MLASAVGTSDLIPSQKFSEFKMLVVRRKLSQITSNYDFDSDYTNNVATAESYIDNSGDMGVGLFTRSAPPTWEDFKNYATTCQVVQDVVYTSVTGEYAYCMGNQSQNAGQTNYLLDVRNMAVANLPQYGYSGITPISDGYMYAYDCWLTPFKPYTFGCGVYDGKIVFSWYGGANLITPSYVDGGSLPGDEPILSGIDTNFALNGLSVNYYSGIAPYQTNWSAPTPSNFKVVPCVMDNKIALNINWFMTTSDTNDALGHPFACQNTYRDDTTISGGTLEDDILYEGILRKYYGQDESVEGENEEEHFKEDVVVCVHRECNITDVLSRYYHTIDDIRNDSIRLASDLSNLSNFVNPPSFLSAPKFLKSIDEEYTESYNDYNNNGYSIKDEAFDEVPFIIPKTSFYAPDPDKCPAPTSSWGETGIRYYLNNNEVTSEYVDFNYGYGHYSNSNYGLGTVGMCERDGDYNTEYNENFNMEFEQTWGLNNEWIDQMIKIPFTNDNKIHFYTFYINKGMYSPVTFAVTYNPYITETVPNNINDMKKVSPYIFCCFGDGCRINGYDHHSNGMSFGGDYRDGILPVAYTGSIITREENDVLTNVYFCEESTETAIYLFKVQQQWYEQGSTATKFFETIGAYIPSVTYKNPNALTPQLGEMTQRAFYGNFRYYNYTDSTFAVDDPITKDGSGNIPTSNPDENSGDGPDSNDPNTKGTNRTHVEPDKPLPPKSTNILATRLINMYTINQSNMSKLAGDLFSQNVFEQIEHGVNKPLDCILRFAESRISPLVESSNSVIKLGVCNTSATGNRVSKDYRDIPCGSIVIQRINGDYTDGEERLEVYLPYIGFKTLDNSILQQTQLFLDYRFNFLNGKCIAILTYKPLSGNPLYDKFEGTKIFLTQFTGDFITTYPIGSTSNTGMLSMLTSTGLGLVSGNSYYARAAIRSLPNSFTPTYEHCGDFGTNLGTAIDRLTPYLRKYSIRHSRPHATTGDNSGEHMSGGVNGETSYKYKVISDCKNGYIQCDNFKLKATPTSITAEECELLKNLFNEGVWKK